MTDELRILLICGSTRESSHTRALLRAIEAGLMERGLLTTFHDLRADPLPPADPEFHHDPTAHPDPRVHAFVQAAAACDGLVLGSPVYHNSFSGVLKNALDHLIIRQLLYKPVGLTSHGGNRNTQAVDPLRIVVRGLLGVAIPSQVCTADDDYENGSHGYTLRSPDIAARIQRFVTELAVITAQMRSLR